MAVGLMLTMTRERPPSPRFLVFLGLVYFAAIIVHPVSGLICLSIFPLLYRSMRQRGPVLAFGQGLLTAGVMFAALALYYALFLTLAIHPDDFNSGLRWMMSYTASAGGPQGWGQWSPHSIALAFVGIGRTLFTTEFAFGIPAVAQQVSALFPTKIIVEEQWLGAQFAPWALKAGFALLACAVIAFCIVPGMAAVALVQAIRHRRDANWHALSTALAYLLPATIFFDWWEPINNEFWIVPCYALALVLGLAIASANWRFAVPGVAIAAAILTLLNGVFGVYPRLDARSDYWIARQQPLARILTRNDMIVENGFLAGNYIAYLSDARLFRTDYYSASPQLLRLSFKHALDAAPTIRSVYVTDLVTDTTATSNPLHVRLPNGGILEQFFQSLPPPNAWISVDGRRLGRYDAVSLRAHLSRTAPPEAPGSQPNSSGR
jgi:hypothetical protein